MAVKSLAALFLLSGTLAGCGGGQPASVAPEPSDAASVKASTVGAADIEKTPGESIEKALEGRIAGVVVGRAPDGGISVRIRNASSLYGNADPLYILDGLPIQAGPSGSLTGINPSDIQSIRVLKDPAELAFYGSRGANGVIVIKTKTARKPDR